MWVVGYLLGFFSFSLYLPCCLCFDYSLCVLFLFLLVLEFLACNIKKKVFLEFDFWFVLPWPTPWVFFSKKKKAVRRLEFRSVKATWIKFRSSYIRRPVFDLGRLNYFFCYPSRDVPRKKDVKWVKFRTFFYVFCSSGNSQSTLLHIWAFITLNA